MTYKRFLKKINLSEADLEEIKVAVARAEDRTSGEIALALAAESSSYAFWELFAAVCTVFGLSLCLFPLAPQVYKIFSSYFWGIQPWHLSAFFCLIMVLIVFLLYLLYNIPFLDRQVIPSEARHQAVTNRAFRCFAQNGVYCTSNHCGILVFLSFFEREVRIIADEGISSKISQDMWNLIADEMAGNLKDGHVKDAFLTVVDRCGSLLCEKFPSQGEKKNELSDGLMILEGEKWA